MKHMPQVVAVMTPFPYSVDIDASVAVAQAIMREHRVRHLPVMQNLTLRGVVSDRDLRNALGRGTDGQAPDATRSTELTVREVFHEDAYTVEAHAPLDDVAATMAERHSDSALVTKSGKLVGVFTARDACRALAHVLRERFPPPSPGTEAA
jgi:CBS domain-containing protein